MHQSIYTTYLQCHQCLVITKRYVVLFHLVHIDMDHGYTMLLTKLVHFRCQLVWNEGQDGLEP